LYFSVKSTHEYVEQHVAETRANCIAGFTTSMKTRPLIIAKLEEFIRNQLITIRSRRIFNELTTFVWNNGKPEAMKSYNDDLVISMAIACWVRDTALVANQRDMEYKRAILGSISKKSVELNTTIPGMVGYTNEQKHRDAIEEVKNYSWIFKG